MRPVLLLPPVLTLGTYKKKKKKTLLTLTPFPNPVPLPSLVPCPGHCHYDPRHTRLREMTRRHPFRGDCPQDTVSRHPRYGLRVLLNSKTHTPPPPYRRVSIRDGDETPLRVSHTPTPHTDHNHDTITTTECDRERDGVSTPSRVRVEGDECPGHNVHRVGECPLS